MTSKLLTLIGITVLVSSAFAMMGSKNEYIPNEELLQPVVSLEAGLSSQSRYKKSVQFKYPGRYVVRLVLRHTEENKPPRENLEKRQFSLKGKLQIISGEVPINTEYFDVAVAENNTGIDLLKFEVEDKDVGSENIFLIDFEAVDKKFDEYFSSVELYVQKQLKHSIYD